MACDWAARTGVPPWAAVTKYAYCELLGANLPWDERKEETWVDYLTNVAKKHKVGASAEVLVPADVCVLDQLSVDDCEQRKRVHHRVP